MKINAVEFSQAGDKYLGRSYSEMDCQAFVERCMADCGYRKDLAGSNAWYRECLRCGWAGTPEDCVKAFGLIPKGALLFILEQDGKEPAKYREDGIGNASHIGIKTGRGKGAIHSSSSRGCVTESEFRDKTIRNGGWNRVGLLNAFDYGTGVNWVMEHSDSSESGIQDSETKVVEKAVMLTVSAPSGATVNLRKNPNKGAPLLERVPVDSEVELLENGSGWSKIRYMGKTGWMMTEFLVADERLIPEGSELSGETYSVIISGLDLTQAKALQANYPGSVIEKEEIVG